MMMVEDHLMLGFATEGVDPLVVANIDGLVPLSFALTGVPQALVLSGASVLLLRAGRAPRWIGWFGIAVAVMSLAGTGTLMRGALFPVSSLVTVLFRVWILALASALLWRARRAAPA